VSHDAAEMFPPLNIGLTSELPSVCEYIRLWRLKHEDDSFLFHAIKANGGRRFIVGIFVLLGCYAA
jgi:hypothetical protein